MTFLLCELLVELEEFGDALAFGHCFDGEKQLCKKKKSTKCCVIKKHFVPLRQKIHIKEMEQTVFELDLLEEARDFLKSLSKEIRGKIGHNIRRVQKGERDKELFKKLDGSEIWEFRTLYNKTYYRLFAFWDKDINTLVIATHGIVKKSQKTPKSEISKAEGIRKLYFENKNKKL